MMQNAKVESEIPFVIGSFLAHHSGEWLDGHHPAAQLPRFRAERRDGKIQGAVSAFALPANAEGIVKASVNSSKLARGHCHVFH